MKLNLSIDGHLKVTDETHNKVVVDKHNAIHPQNMSRIIARALAHEDNGFFFRLALGNGGTFVDATGEIVFKEPNVGLNGEGWEARLYNETYSEVIDDISTLLGVDIGSAGPDNVRIGQGSYTTGDPTGVGTTSSEVGIQSVVTIKAYLNENEPGGQLQTNAPVPTLTDDEKCFLFDELGIYSAGLPALATSGHANINVGDKTSEDDSGLSPNSTLVLDLDIDGQNYTNTYNIPASGTGANGVITYGDLCEGINSGSWLASSNGANDIHQKAYVFITDRSGGTYPSITGKQSYGYLTFQSKTTGETSSVYINCNPSDNSNMATAITGGICDNCNINNETGKKAGVINDPTNPQNERERLLTHVTFTPFLKTTTNVYSIEYTFTITVLPTADTKIDVTTVNAV